jgi:hypothetical protein
VRTRTTLGGLAALAIFTATPAHALVTLFEHGLNIDGGLTFEDDPLPAGVNAGAFNFTSGLGILSISVTGAGAHNVIAYFDHEIDEAINTFFNETGSANGLPSAGQSWEIDEPGFVFGDIFANLQAGALDNTNAFALPDTDDDVSMALGYNFVLTAGQTGLATFFASAVNLSTGFFLRQLDPDSQSSVFFWSTLEISGVVDPPDPPTGVPEPGTLALLAAGLLSLGLRRRRR